jgi:hypothetical protein
MPTWTEVQEHMRSKYLLDNDRADVMSMVWSYDDGRKQKIIVRKYAALGRTMVEFKSPFARGADIDARKMLEMNAEMPLATVALSGDVYIAVYNACLEHLHMADFDLYVSRVAAVADTLEETYASRDDF